VEVHHQSTLIKPFCGDYCGRCGGTFGHAEVRRGKTGNALWNMFHNDVVM
jgi:hypothetical protein